MHYPIAIEPGDDKHAFGGVVPDLPGCFSAGDSLDAAMTQARDVIPLHLEGLLDGINTIADDGYQAAFSWGEVFLNDRGTGMPVL